MKTEKPLECPIIAGYPVNSINERGFGNVPTRVMDDVRLSIGARCLYSLLASHAGSQHEAWPGVKRIIATLRCSENSFYKYRQELCDFGYVTIETRNTRYGRRTVYVLEQIVPYSSCIDDDNGEEFSTIPSSEPYLKICGMASEADRKDGGMWKNTGGKPSHTSKFEVSHTSNFEVQNINNGIKEKNSTTNSAVDDPLENSQVPAASADASASDAPNGAVSGAPAPRGGLQNDKTEEDTRNDTIHKAFAELEARSMRRTKSASVLADAEAMYRKLVEEGSTPRQISAAYSRYQAWVLKNNVKHVMGLASWLESDNGFRLNSLAVESAREAAERKQAPAAQTEGDLDVAEYRKRSQAVSMIDDDAEYRVEFAEQSDDEHLRHLAALVRAENPITLGNGLVDDRLAKRPSYVVLWSRTNKKEHHRDYVLWAYERLKTEGKVR